MIGKSIGDGVTIETPAGSETFEIEDVLHINKMYADNWALRAKEKDIDQEQSLNSRKFLAKFSIPKKLTVVLDLGAVSRRMVTICKRVCRKPGSFCN